MRILRRTVKPSAVIPWTDLKSLTGKKRGGADVALQNYDRVVNVQVSVIISKGCAVVGKELTG